jgi:hypothetical protein
MSEYAPEPASDRTKFVVNMVLGGGYTDFLPLTAITLADVATP